MFSKLKQYNSDLRLYYQLRARYSWETSMRKGVDPDRYFVIRRKGDLGLFSYVITTLGQIDWALNHRFVPVVDMMSYPNTYLGTDLVGTKNAWEYFFEQPLGIGLSDIEGSIRCIYSGDVPTERPNDGINCLTPSTKEYSYWKNCANRYLRLSKEAQAYVTAAYQDIFSSVRGKTLGILCRGTDYTVLKPYGHPVQPTVDTVIRKAKELLSLNGYSKIFLATEDESIYQTFCQEFGDLIFTYQKNRFIYNFHTKQKLSKLLPDDSTVKKNNGMEYLATIYLLSKCDAFIAGRTSGTVGVMLMTNGFEYQHIWDLGLYQ